MDLAGSKGWWDLRTFLRKVENRELILERNWAWFKLTWSHGQHCASDSDFTNMLNTANNCNGYCPTCPAFANMAHNYMSSILPASFSGITLSIYSFCLLPSLIKILLSCYWNVGWVGVQLPSTLYKAGIPWQPVWTKSQESWPLFHLERYLPNWSVLKFDFGFVWLLGFFALQNLLSEVSSSQGWCYSVLDSDT